MADKQQYIQHDTSLFSRLRRLFSNDVIIRDTGNKELRVMDVNKIQRSGRYQTNSLVDRFSRLYIYNNRNIFNPNLNYQTLRIQMYSDYEAMDTDPIVSSALDIVADECLVKNDQGEILTIKSSDENIKRTLTNLFYDVLNIDFNLWGWVRGMLKYGDFFLKLEISEKFGIYNVLPYSVYHISRLEGINPDKPTEVVFDLDPDGLASSQDPNYVPKDSKGVIRLQNYEVAHFRLLTDTNYLPYGRSYIEPARKIYKQLALCLPGDAKIWVPGGYVRMEDIKAGDPIYSYDYNTNRFVETVVTHKLNTGEKPTFKVYTKHRCLEASGDHPVMVEGGTMKKVSELTLDDRIVLGKDLVDQNKGELPSFRIDESKLRARLPLEYLEEFNNLRKRCLVCGTELKANNHKHFEMHGLTSEEYFKQFDIDRKELGSFARGKLAIPFTRAKHYCELYGFNPENLNVIVGENANSKSTLNISALEKSASMFVRFFGFMLGDGWSDKYTLSFSLGNRLDKSWKYVEYLRNLGMNVKVCDEGSTRAYAVCRDRYLVHIFEQFEWRTGCKNKIMPAWVWNLSKENKVEFLHGFSDADGTYDPESDRWSLCGINEKLITDCFVLAQQVGLTTSNLSIHKGGHEGYWGNIVNSLYGFGYNGRSYHTVVTETGAPVEKVVKIEQVSTGKQVYDIRVDSELHNFIADGVVVSNCEDAAMIHRIMRAPEKRIFYVNVGQIPPNEVEQFMQKTINGIKKTPYVGPDGQYNLKFNMQNMMEDFYIPVRGGDATTRVETTPGLNYDGITDIRYYQEKLFAALKIPKAFMGFEKDLSGKATLSAEDIKFARTVERIQRIIESELTKIALVHLYARGFTGESLVNFELKLSTPSIIFEQEKIALLKEKTDLAKQMLDSGLFSSDYIYENIFDLSEDQYIEMRDLVREDGKRKFRQAQIENEGNDPALSGKSYGTPHDLASMYGRRSSPAPKGAGVGEVPTGYAEKPRTEKDRKWGEPGPEGGRPRIRASFVGTQDNPVGGFDPTGRITMHGGQPSDYENVMEGKVNVTFPEQPETEIGAAKMLNEGQILRVETMLAGLDEKLRQKEG